MKEFVLLIICIAFVMACGSSTGSNITKSNVNCVNSVPYLPRESDYALAQYDLDIGPLKEYVGKTASEMKLWQNKVVVKRLRNLMGDDFTAMQKFWNTETPLQKFGDYMMLTGCEKGNCSVNRYVIFLSTSEGLQKVVHIGRDNIKEWSVRDPIIIPPPFEKELARMKSRE